MRNNRFYSSTRQNELRFEACNLISGDTYIWKAVKLQYLNNLIAYILVRI